MYAAYVDEKKKIVYGIVQVENSNISRILISSLDDLKGYTFSNSLQDIIELANDSRVISDLEKMGIAEELNALKQKLNEYTSPYIKKMDEILTKTQDGGKQTVGEIGNLIERFGNLLQSVGKSTKE